MIATAAPSMDAERDNEHADASGTPAHGAAKGTLYSVDRFGRLNLYFHPGQAAAWRSRARFTWMLSGTQGGKTSFAPLWLWREMRERGPGDYLAVTATYPLLQLKMLPEYIKFFKHTLGLGEWHAMSRVFAIDGERAAKHFGDAAWRTTDSRIIFGSGINPEGLESATAKAAALDECGQDDFRLQSYEAILRRLSIHQGRILGGTTIYNMGWLKSQAYDPWRNGDPDHNVIQFASTINPAFPEAEFARARRTMQSWKFDMFYRGEFSRPGGLIYDSYSDEYREQGGHKVRPFELPAAWPRYVGVDFGAVNMALIWLAKHPAERAYYAYRELHGGTMSTKLHAQRARRLSANERVWAWWGGAKSEKQQRLDWEQAGVRLQEPPVGDLESGIDRVDGLFHEHRLFVFDTLTGLRDELGTYGRELDEYGEPTEKIKDKETYHRLDALRYVVAGVTAPGLRSALVQGIVRRGWGL